VGGLRHPRWTNGVPSLYIVVTPKYFLVQIPEGIWPPWCCPTRCCSGQFCPSGLMVRERGGGTAALHAELQRIFAGAGLWKGTNSQIG
jgi:hypothetical protein